MTSPATCPFCPYVRAAREYGDPNVVVVNGRRMTVAELNALPAMSILVADGDPYLVRDIAGWFTLVNLRTGQVLSRDDGPLGEVIYRPEDGVQ